MFMNSVENLHSSVWLDEWRQFMQEPNVKNVPISIKNRLVAPLKGGDPVFASALSLELVSQSNISISILVLSSTKPLPVAFIIITANNPIVATGSHV